MQLERHIAERLRVHAPPGASLCVALSGGLDSVVLLDLTARYSGASGARPTAVHVHHGLSPNADAWADFCRALCAERGIALDVERVQVDRASPDGLEAAARTARYGIYAARREGHVLLAHHLEDQSETVLLQLLRGTGLKGIAAMPEAREVGGSGVRILRPLLGVPRAALRAHAEAHGLRWIEDESNASPRHDRNYLRHEIAPRLDERFPRWREAAARFARHAAAAESLFAALAQVDGLPANAGEPLRAEARLAPERRANLLRAFLALNGAAMPDEARLGEMSRQLFDARGDSRVRIGHGGFVLRRFRDRILIEWGPGPAAEWERPWNGEPEVVLDGAGGLVRFEPAAGEGIAAGKAGGPGWRLVPRSGGERLRPDPARPTRTLKNLLQEHDIPPWERGRMPLLFHGERLVWVPGIGIDADYACPPGGPGLRPTWVQKPRGN